MEQSNLLLRIRTELPEAIEKARHIFDAPHKEVSVLEVFEFCETSTWTVEQVFSYVTLKGVLPDDKDHPEQRLNEARRAVLKRLKRISFQKVLDFCETSTWNVEQVLECIAITDKLPFPFKDENPESALYTLWQSQYIN